MRVFYRLNMVIAAIGALAATATATAHHSFATHYDSDIVVELSGVLSEVDLRSPHSFLGVTRQRDDGTEEVWEVEAHAFALLRRMGVDETTLRVGDPVTITGPRSRVPEKNLLLATFMITADGNEFEMLRSIRSAPTYRVTDARLEGRGTARFAGRWLTYIEGQAIAESPLPLNEAGRAARAAFDPQNTPAMECVPPNLPAMLFLPYIYEITTNGDEIRLFQEYQSIDRRVTLGASEPDTGPPGFGARVGRMEGETLVIESRGFEPNLAGLASGWEPNGNGADVPSSAEKTLVERYSLSPDGNKLTVQYTLDDPVYLSEPYVSEIVWDRVPDDTPIYDATCESDIATRSTLNAAPRED